ncbi:MAG TPA: PQQ-binding-like beta-propeller repeat protein, partial [Tepidisphaeraceae bacterium]|nr:PQQ-binding-like beta-propeller repeat protein [Tepidisphaeraceae bacterium]
WRKNLNSDMGGKMASGWGNSESAIVDGDRVIVTPGGKNGTMAALNKKTGEVLWRSTELTDAAAYMAPVVVDFGGVRQAITLTHESVAGVSVADGKLLWRATRPGKTAVIPTPVVKVDGNIAHVFVTSGYGVGCDLLKVTAAGGAFKVDRVYKNTAMVNHHGGVILLGDHVYGYSDGRGWTSVNLLTGENGFKDKDLTDKGTITYADGRFYLRGEKTGDVVLLEATPDKATERGRLKQPDRTKLNAWAHVVIANGKMYVKDQGTLYCYDVKAK